MTKAQFLEQQSEAAEVADSAGGSGVLLCDCDGTLVETERDGHRVAFNKAFKEKGYDCEWEVGLYGELLKTGGGKERMTRYFTDYNAEAWPHEDPPAKDHPAIMELHELKTKLFMEIVRSGDLPLREGVFEMLKAAKDAGWKLAVCSTSNEESVKSVVETLLPEFAATMPIFAGDCVEAKKPDPAIYKLAAKKLGVAPMKCVVVEDTNIGVQSGKAAGMQVLVTKSIYSEDEDFSAADLVVPSAAELDFENDVASMLPMLELA
jgi:HAD superfamily hydrolase (TIGR01509 family)